MDWSPAEVEFLKENIYQPRSYIAKQLGRTNKSIYAKIRDLKQSHATRTTQDDRELVIKHAYIKTDKQISVMIGIPEKRVMEMRISLFDKKKNRPYEYETLCIYCKNATGGCSWSVWKNGNTLFKPVEGWTVVKKIVDNKNETYAVMDCPEYERG